MSAERLLIFPGYADVQTVPATGERLVGLPKNESSGFYTIGDTGKQVEVLLTKHDGDIWYSEKTAEGVTFWSRHMAEGRVR